MAGSDLSALSAHNHILDAGDLTGYSIHAIDGEIGKVDKHDVDTGTSFLLVSTGGRFRGHTVMLPARLVERIDHEDQSVTVRATVDAIKNAPEYQPDRLHDEGYHAELSSYYGT